MVAAQKPIELEGKWEEILLRGGEFAGQRVRVTVLPSASIASAPVIDRKLDQILAPLIEQAKELQWDPTPPKLSGLSADFSEGVAEQLRKQGLKS